MNIAILILAIVPWLGGQGYTRNEPTVPWPVSNFGVPSQLFLNGTFQSSESGNASLEMPSAWAIHNQGVKVGVLFDWHGNRVSDCVKMTSPASEIYTAPLLRWYADNVADAIAESICAGCKVVVVPGGLVNGPSLALDQVLLESRQAVIVWAAPDTINASMDTTLAEYPYNSNLPNVLYVNGYRRDGTHCQSALGSNCVAAPNRIIVCGNPKSYSDGTSYGVGLVGGIVALLRHKNPTWTASECVSVIQATATPAGPIRRINAAEALRFTRWGE